MANSVGKFTVKITEKSPPTYAKSPSIPLQPRSRYLKWLNTTTDRSSFWQGAIWGSSLGLTALISGTLGIAIAFVTPTSLRTLPVLNRLVPTSQPQSPTESLLPYRLGRPVNILVMGVDRVLDAPPNSPQSLNGRSDTLLLLRFNAGDRSVRMLSIPRDTRVEIPGIGYSKINDANVRGGSGLASQVVSQTLNQVPIDRYIRVTTDSFKKIIDLVGGVEVYVPEPMVYRDVTQKLDINLAPGWQTLNGNQAEQFARFRKDQFGDIGRVQRQQILLKALQKRLYSPAVLPRIPQAIKIVREAIDTNMSLEEMLALANFGLGLQRDNLKMVMLPGRFSRPEEFDARSYWIMSSTGCDRIMASYFDQATDHTIPQSFQTLRIAIQNATDDPDASQKLVQSLRKAGFTNIYITRDASQLIAQTEIVVQRGDLQSAQALQSRLGIGRVEADSTGDLDSDLTIRIGLDSQKITLGESVSPSISDKP